MINCDKFFVVFFAWPEYNILYTFWFVEIDTKLGQGQTSNFSCAEPNANEVKQELSLLTLGSAHEKFDV